MRKTKASQGEGRKRRSFLPAPRKSTALSPSSPQATTYTAFPAPSQQPSTTSAPPPRPPPSSSPSPGLGPGPDGTRSSQTHPPPYGKGLRVGAQVKIGGIKPGILRYLGTTHLAPGIFCGIELYDSDGCHDGEVNGHRYFSCAPRHGIFAPKEKVCLAAAPSGTLGKLASADSDGCYSSTESLSDKTNKAFREYEEGELEAIDYSTLSPESSYHEAVHRTEQVARRSERCIADLSPSDFSNQQHFSVVDSADVSHKKFKSGLPKAAKSFYSQGSSLLYSKLKFPQSYTSPRYGDTPATVERHHVAPDAALEAAHDADRSSPRLSKTVSARSSEDSEDDGLVTDSLSAGIKKQLRADSRQYLNFTFDSEEPQQSLDLDGSGSDTNSRNETAGTKSASMYVQRRVAVDVYGDSSDDGSLNNPPVGPSGSIRAPGSECEKSYYLAASPVVWRPNSAGTSSSESNTNPAAAPCTRPLYAGEDARFDLSGTRVPSDVGFPPPPDLISSEPGEVSADRFVTVYDSLDSPEDEALSEGGYGNQPSGDGSSFCLLSNAPATVEYRAPPSYTVHSGPEVSLSHSFVAQGQEIQGDGRGRKGTGSSGPPSQSYSTARSDVSSSPLKSRKISSGSSSINEEAVSGDSSSTGTEPKTDSSGDNKGESLDDSSNGPSPEVSQALEWDYGQEFDGKAPLGRQENVMTTSASTGTSESMSDALRDVSDNSDGLFETEMPSNLADDSDSPFETPDNEFESIDSLDDFPIFGKDNKTLMTDSGISDKDFESSTTKSTSSTVCGGNSSDEYSREDDASSLTTARAASSDSSQETLAAEYMADTPGSVEEKDLPCDEEGMAFTSSNAVDSDDLGRIDLFCDGNSNSPASVVSIEDVSGLQDKTLILDEVGQAGEDALMDDSSGTEVVMTTGDSSSLEDLTMSETRIPTTFAADVFYRDVYDRDDGDGERTLSKKDRPTSFISVASSDTGYVPDSESEHGTTTSTSPSDWGDRMGVVHPTSYAPLDSDTLAASFARPPASPPQPLEGGGVGPALRPVISEVDDDLGCELTVTTEDDRIEADQVDGPRGVGVEGVGTEVTLVVVDSADTVVNDSKGGDAHETGVADNDDHDDRDDHDSAHDEEVDQTGVSPVQGDNEADDKGENTSMTKENQQQKTGTGKKYFKMSKKRMDLIDHKMPNIKVASKLADYINTPAPVITREEKEKKNVSNNTKNTVKKRNSVTEMVGKANTNNRRASSFDKSKDNNIISLEKEKEEKLEKPEKPKPIIKRTPPKSKWGNIMCQIEASKDTIKPKPKSEIKSTLALYLQDKSADVKDEPILNPKRHEFKSKIKPLPPPPPKIDLSKIKSKLNVPTAASARKAAPKHEFAPSTSAGKRASRTSRDSSPAATDANGKKKGKEAPTLSQTVSGVTSLASSRTDLSICDPLDNTADDGGAKDGTGSKRASVDLTRVTRGSVDMTSAKRSSSIHSATSEVSERRSNRRDSTRASTGQAKAASSSPFRLSSRAETIRQDGRISATSSQRSSTSPTPLILKPIKPKPKNNGSAVSPPSKPAWGASKPNNSSALSASARDSSRSRLSKSKVEPLKKGVGAGATTISTSATTTTTTTTSATRANARGPGAQKEIIRLESLCEARTKELTHVKMQLRATTQAFDAMTVLVNYCCTELDAFQCPVLAQKLETVHRQLSDCLAQIAELSSRKESLEQALDQLGHEKEEACRQAQELEAKLVADHQVHEQTQRDLDETHNAALTAQRDELSLKHDEALQKFNQYHDKQMEMMRHGTERQISDLKNENKLEINGIRISHLEEIQELRNKHDSQMEELHKQHRCKLEDITHRFEGIKLSLSEKLDSLRGECDDLRHRARQSEEALQRDADVKVQMALAPFLSLPKEIESLKTVVDMRNEEIQKLRTKTMDMEKQLEEIAIVKEKNISLQQKVENLQAIINIKSDHEKQLHEKCQILMRKYDRESRANKRLSMDYEQVMWRMSQSAEFGSSESLTKRQVSRSPSHSEGNSPDRRRTQSPGAHNSDVVLRVKKRNSNSASEADRKLRSRSATFVMEKPESLDSHVSSPPPQTKSKSRKGTPQKEMVQSEIEAEKSDSDDSKQRMCQSADAKLLENTSRDSADMMARQGGRLLMENGSRNQQNQLELSGELADSYSRSISGVSDSGVYDSLTTSEMLDTSQVSMGSDWMVPTGGSVSFNIVESSSESASNSSGNNVTMLEVDSAIDGQHMQNSALNGEGDLHIQNSSDSNCYHYQVLLPGDGEASYDSVFHDNDQESVSIDSGLLSLENMDVVSNSDSRLKSESEDFTLAGYSCSGENLVRREIFAEHQGEGHGLGSSSES